MTVLNSPIPTLTPTQAAAGAPILPIKRVWVMSDKEFEKLVEAWVDTLKNRYVSVAHFGGTGDKGVDIAGFCDGSGFQGVWDAYQCKQLDHPLYPTEAYPEVGKLIWHIARGDYAAPRTYSFVGSRDLGTTLSQLLYDAAKFKSEVERHWDTHVANAITETDVVKLTGDVKNAFEHLDFRIFKHQKLQAILNDVKGSAYYIATFGGGLPPRPEPAAAPVQLQASEIVYVEKLRRAYSAHSGKPIPDANAIAAARPFNKHFERQRRAFYYERA